MLQLETIMKLYELRGKKIKIMINPNSSIIISYFILSYTIIYVNLFYKIIRYLIKNVTFCKYLRKV